MSGFWQKRRAAVAAEAEAEVRVHAAQVAEAEEAALAERSDDDLLAEFDLPAPEDLVSGEQLRAFLKAQLPQRLKTRALRSFWKTNPVLACLDGLNDYDDDYSNLKTLSEGVAETLRDWVKDKKEEDTVNEPEQVADNEEETLINEVDDSINEAEETESELSKSDEISGEEKGLYKNTVTGNGDTETNEDDLKEMGQNIPHKE